MTPVGLRCAHLDNPLAVAPDRVRFSWLLTGSGSQSRCVSEPAAVSFTRQALRSYGFSSWRIIPPQRAGGQLCWQAQPDPATHTIQIVPQPGVFSDK